MDDYAKQQLLATVEKGRRLYIENCTACHGTFKKGKNGVPDFTNTQIDNYSRRFLMRSPENHALALKMHPAQLNEILTFLRLRIMKDSVSNKNKQPAPRINF